MTSEVVENIGESSFGEAQGADDFTFQSGRNNLTGYIGIALESEESVKKRVP